MLKKRILEKGMDLEPLKYYVESFQHGVSPHAGAGIGLERVVFLYLGEHSASVLYCIVLCCVVLYCIVLCCVVLWCVVLYCIVLYCIVLYCIVLYSYCIVLYCNVLYCVTFSWAHS